jgi:hypothetical protein
VLAGASVAGLATSEVSLRQIAGWVALSDGPLTSCSMGQLAAIETAQNPSPRLTCAECKSLIPYAV